MRLSLLHLFLIQLRTSSLKLNFDTFCGFIELVMNKVSANGLPLGTSNTDLWRLKPSIRCQLLVDRSKLCTYSQHEKNRENLVELFDEECGIFQKKAAEV